MKVILQLLTIITIIWAQSSEELNKKAEILYSQGKKSEAHQLFLKAYDLDNNSEKVMGNLSVSFLGRKEYEQAIYWSNQLLKNSTNSTLIANGNYNIAKAYEALKEYKKSRQHFYNAYSANPRSVYLRSIDKLNQKVDKKFIALYGTNNEDIKPSKTEELKLSEKGYGEPTKLHEILGIDKSKPLPDFIDLELMSESVSANQINLTNDYKKDIYLNTINGTGRFTDYFVITKTESNKWRLLKETVGGDCCYHEPSFLSLEGLIYFLDTDKLLRYGKNGVLKCHYNYKPDTTSRIVKVEEIMNSSLFKQLVPKAASLNLNRSSGYNSLNIDINQNGKKDLITRRGETSGGMGQWFRYEVKINNKQLWNEDETEGLRSTKFKFLNNKTYLINIYDDLTCKVFLYENNQKYVKSIVQLKEEFTIEYIWNNLLK